MSNEAEKLQQVLIEYGQTYWGGVAPGSAKSRFKSASTRMLRALARDLGLEAGSYRVTFNPAGPAVSGEASLEAEDVYVQVSDTDRGVLYRSRKGMKDYSGGRNRWMQVGRIVEDWPMFVRAVKEARGGE